MMIMKVLKQFMITLIVCLAILSPVHAYQAIIFDCDGVLVDTEHLKFLAWQQALVNFKVELQESDYLPLVGYSSNAIATAIKKQKNHDFNDEDVITQKNKIYVLLQKQGVPLLDEAVNFLKLIITQKKTLGIKIAIVSSAPHREILENLRQLGIPPTDFEAILSGSDDLKHIHDPQGTNKPKPYIYQLAAQTLGVQARDCLVFEDSGAGVIAAAQAGMNVIAIPNAYTSTHDFSLALKIATFSEIDLKFIQKTKVNGDEH